MLLILLMMDPTADRLEDCEAEKNDADDGMIGINLV
jgi:hypothetical protein